MAAPNVSGGGAVVRERAKSEANRPTIASVEQTAKQQADLIRTRMGDTKKRTDRITEIGNDLQQALKTGDLDKVRELNVSFAEARESLATNTRDLAEAMMGLGKGFKDIGIALEVVQEATPEEAGLVTAAEALVERAKGRLGQANIDLAAAGQKTTLFGQRKRAEEAAEAAIAKAKADIETAEAGVSTARQLAEQKKRERLQSMSIEQSMQRLQAIAQQIIQIARDRIDSIVGNLEAIQSGRAATVEDLKQYAKQVEEGDALLERINADLSSLRTEQSEYQANSPEWMAMVGKIREKERELGEAEATRNKAFALSQDGQRFLEMYKVQEEAQRSLLQFHQTWIALLEEAVKQRSTLYESHLGLLQAAGDQQAMAMVDSTAVATDQRITEDAIKALAATQRGMLERLEAMPGRLADLRQVTGALAQGQSNFEKKFGNLLDEFRKNWGTNPGYDARERTAPPPGQQ